MMDLKVIITIKNFSKKINKKKLRLVTISLTTMIKEFLVLYKNKMKLKMKIKYCLMIICKKKNKIAFNKLEKGYFFQCNKKLDNLRIKIYKKD